MSRVPPGIGILTSSPTCLPSSPRPMGETRGNQTVGRIGFFACDELVSDFFVLVDIEHHDRGAEPDTVTRDLTEIDHRKHGEALFELGQSGIHESLTLLGSMKFRILPEIAVGPRLEDFLRQFVAQLVFQRRYFVLQLSLEIFHD